jgi:predicted phosphodiesterase
MSSTTLFNLDLNPAAARFHVVVSGHSHKPGHTNRDGVLYMNPGSAGPRRLSITVALLHLRPSLGSVEYFDLSGLEKHL